MPHVRRTVRLRYKNGGQVSRLLKNKASSWPSILRIETDGSANIEAEASNPTAEQRLLDVVHKNWGYDGFRPLQRESMLAAMESRDSLTVLPTGGGKSLCYQAPAVCREGLAVVVSPLIALMKDQVDALTQCGIPAACVNSSLSVEERREVAAKVRSGELKLLFAAPERLVQPRTIDFLRNANVSFIAIDEAHCISNWGHDFRPEYRQLSNLRTAFPQASIHAFTATATEKVRRDIVQQLDLKDPEIHVGNFDRPNLFYRVERRHDPIAQICEVIDRHPNESGVIYCISRARVEQTAESLKAAGYSALGYHAGLEPEQRKEFQEAFIDEKVDIIVATVAFGMGIDKSNVRYVIHAEMPSSLEGYQQESGRAGRDGLEAECCLLYSGRDSHTWQFLIDQSDNEANKKTATAALKKMEAFCFSNVCRHQQLVRHFGQNLDSKDCGACDVCSNEVEALPDSLVIAQKIISSVYRQNQGFGAEYTCQVLRGAKNKRVLSNRHDQLSTYGLLRDESSDVVRGWIDQLISQGYLDRSGEHSVLVITEIGSSLLKGKETPTLTRPQGQTERLTRKSSGGEANWEGVDRGLFEELRQLRLQLSVERGVPPYVVLGDVTLRELARTRPSEVGALTQIYGIGEQKMLELGQKLISCITAYARQHDIPTNVGSIKVSARPRRAGSSIASRYFELFDEGLGVDEVAMQLDRAQSTVSTYLEQYLHARNIDDPHQWVDSKVVNQINKAIQQVGASPMKAVFEYLDGNISYADIRIVIACRQIEASKRK